MKCTRKELLNSIYNKRYNDLQHRGAYCVVYDKNSRPTFLKNIKIDSNCEKYISPEEVPIVNTIMNNVFKNNMHTYYIMDNLVSVGEACKKFALELVSPYKHTRVEDVMSDNSIDNVYEKKAKGVALAIGNLITQFLMLNIDVAKNMTVYSITKYQEYLEAQNKEEYEDESSSCDDCDACEEENCDNCDCTNNEDDDEDVEGDEIEMQQKMECDDCDGCEEENCDNCDCTNNDDDDIDSE